MHGKNVRKGSGRDKLTYLLLRADPPEVIAQFDSDPETHYAHRQELELALGRGSEALWRGGLAATMLKSAVVKHIQNTIHDRKLLEQLTPDFEVGCRRFTPGDHYLHALQQDNVSMISDDIVRITETGIEDRTGTIHDVDIIVCATGFDVSFEPRLPITGRDRHSLAENWGKDKPTESYMGATVAHIPNFFAFCAPIHPVAGSFYPSVAATSDYIIAGVDHPTFALRESWRKQVVPAHTKICIAKKKATYDRITQILAHLM